MVSEWLLQKRNKLHSPCDDSLPCIAGFTTDVALAALADHQAAQGRSHTVVQWGNWTAGMPVTQSPGTTVFASMSLLSHGAGGRMAVHVNVCIDLSTGV